jgi:hypothetical protein
VVVELPRLVDDLRRNANLADVVQQRRELRVAPIARIELQPVGHLEDERHDIAAVTAGVRVVGLHDVA